MTTMRYRVLGRSGLKVSELCLGTMNFGGPTDEVESGRIMAAAREAGCNFVDTANVYTAGRSEMAIGRSLAGQRHNWVLATKVAQPTGQGPNDRGLSRTHIVRACEASLGRLATDYIDLYYIHRVDPTTSWESLASTMGELIRQGKIREWALSNVRAWHIPLISEVCRKVGVPEPVALQPYYNLMNRQPEVELLPAARHYGLGVVPYSPVARGVLTGKYRPGSNAPPETRAGRGDKRMLETEWRPESLAIAERLERHAAARGCTLVHWAVAWVLNNRAVSSVIAGPRTLEQWQGYLGALGYVWTAEDEALADSLVVTGHASTPGYNDPGYPIEGRFAIVPPRGA
jgi:aryl-alcohol dehydrogenase-like predicted oxidoreductase